MVTDVNCIHCHHFTNIQTNFALVGCPPETRTMLRAIYTPIKKITTVWAPFLSSLTYMVAIQSFNC